MGKKKSFQDRGGAKAGRTRYGGEKSYAHSEAELRRAGTIEPPDSYACDSDDSEIDCEFKASKRPAVNTRLCMWEFGQNDPKRDSGSKLKRLGYASLLKIGQSFPGNTNQVCTIFGLIHWDVCFD